QATDLVLHLVASHHGHARPFAPVVPDSESVAVSGHHDGMVIALDAADRVRLVEPPNLRSGISGRVWRPHPPPRWGGLAYLEAILRLGDWYGSEHLVEEGPSRASTPPESLRDMGIAPVTTADDALVLTGLDGGNPLGFLAALGTLLVLRRDACPQARL